MKNLSALENTWHHFDFTTIKNWMFYNRETHQHDVKDLVWDVGYHFKLTPSTVISPNHNHALHVKLYIKAEIKDKKFGLKRHAHVDIEHDADVNHLKDTKKWFVIEALNDFYDLLIDNFNLNERYLFNINSFDIYFECDGGGLVEPMKKIDKELKDYVFDYYRTNWSKNILLRNT
jgi:hypothetical protein